MSSPIGVLSRTFGVGRRSARSLLIAAAIPGDSQRAASQAAFMRAVQADEVIGQLRADAHRNLIAVAWALAHHADWTSMCARPTWTRLGRLNRLSRSTVARCVRLLRDRGLLGVVETGSTKATRGFQTGKLIAKHNAKLPAGHPDRIDPDAPRAAEYVLCVPQPQEPLTGAPPAATPDRPAATHPVDGTDTPSALSERRGIPTRAREETGQGDENGTKQARYPQGAAASGRAGMLAACQRLQVEDLTLRRVSARMLRHLLRPLLAAGATVADVRHVLHHAPDGRAWSYTTTPNHVPAWVRWRLAHWIGDDGALRATLPSQAAAQRAAQARDHHAAQRARTTDTAAAQARSTRISHSHAATARAMLAAASTRAAATIRAHQERALTA